MKKISVFFLIFFLAVSLAFSAIHVVEKGETLSLIALNYTGSASNLKKLAEFNGLNPNTPIYAGMKIAIPDNLYKPIKKYIVPAGFSFETYFKSAEMAVGEGDYFKASGYYYKVFRMKENAVTLFNYLLALFHRGFYNEILRYEKSSYKSAKLFYLFGLTNEKLDRIDKAEYYYKMSIKFAPTYFLPYRALNIIYKKENRPDKAKEILVKFKKALE